MINIDKGRYWDKAWQLIDGCTPCSPGCEHCWSAALAHRFMREGEPGHDTGILTKKTRRFNGDIVLHPERLDAPLKRKKPTVYAVWNDLHHRQVNHYFKARTYRMIENCPQHTFLILTKRAKTLLDFYKGLDFFNNKITSEPINPTPPNLWNGITICNQQEADEKIPIFLQIPGNKFLSIEPMLSGINLGIILLRISSLDNSSPHPISNIDAVILGGETGPGARHMLPEWIQSIRDQCQSAGVSFFFKQWGSYWGKGKDRILDGRTHDDLPWYQVEKQP